MRPDQYSRLPTERHNPRAKGLDRKSALAAVRLILKEDQAVARAAARRAGPIAKAARLIAERLDAGSRLFFIGAGTSGRLGVMEAAECPPTFGTDPRAIQAVMAGGPECVFRSKEGAEDDERAGAKAVGALAKGDIAVGIAASGVTPFVRAALAEARRRRCPTVLITCNRSPAKAAADIIIALDVGPEILAGSTRMKSGTASKLVLNAMTTAAMVELGKVYDGWMVDLKPTSRKLYWRGVRLVARLGGVREGEAERLFNESGRHVKTAVVMARKGVARPRAREALQRAGGRLRGAIR